MARRAFDRLREVLAALERRPVAVILGAAVLAVAAAFGLGDLAGYHRVRHELELSRLDPIWLAACFCGEAVAYLGYILAVRDTARVDGGPELGASASTQSVVAGFGVFAATRSSGGFAVDYWILRRAGEDRDGAIARVLALSALEYAVLAPAALVSAIFLALHEQLSDALTLPWLAVIPGGLVAVWLTSPKRAPRYADPGDGGAIRRGFAHTVAGLSILRSLLLSSPREHGLGLLGATLYWTGDIACLWAALQVYSGHRISLPALILGYATGYVLTRRSLPAGGAGVVEIALTFALHWVGLPFVPALLGVVTYRIFNFWLPMVPAVAVLPTIAELRAEFAEAEREAVRDRTGKAQP